MGRSKSKFGNGSRNLEHFRRGWRSPGSWPDPRIKSKGMFVPAISMRIARASPRRAGDRCFGGNIPPEPRDATDEVAGSFYKAYQFLPPAVSGRRLFLPMAEIARLFA